MKVQYYYERAMIDGQKAWEWKAQVDKEVFGGYCATKAQAINDAMMTVKLYATRKNEDKKIGPKEFAEKMKAIGVNNGTDFEAAHVEADALLCETLEWLGYAEGVRDFRDIPKWYA